MNNPKISVVFTSYNHKEYLRQALDSLLSQTFKDFELIIIDDCSTDGSQEILKEYAQKDHRIRLTLNEKNSGSYVYSTNQGASLATAPYLIFAQCDDYAEQTQFEKLYCAITEYKVAVAFSRSNMVGENNEYLGDDFNVRDTNFKKKYRDGGVITKDNAFNSLINSCMIPNLSAAIISRKEFEKLHGLSDKYVVLADWDFWIKMADNCDFYYIAEPLNNFRQHGNTIRSTIKETRQWAERFKMYKNAIDIAPYKKNKIIDILALSWLISAYGNFSLWWESKSEIMKMGKEFSDRWIISVCKACIKVPFIFISHRFNKFK